ncbi:MAG TPA: HAD-IB family hydrolase [Solirubrobacteraceae bacterium]|nr:HAD-IB family hydrolase [Solirubrobacteraceae bacterium]
MPPQATIAAFDFDGTLTTRDSLLRFVAWRRRRAAVALDLVRTLPFLALYGARVVGNETHKMALFSRAFRDMPADAYERWARDFASSELPRMIRAEALERVRFHQERGDRVVLVSASPTDWIVPWAASEGITEIIGNPAEVSDGRVSGRLAGVNCYGQEKLRRLLALNPERESYTLFAYGDGRGDRELLAAANHAYYRRFE